MKRFFAVLILTALAGCSGNAVPQKPAPDTSQTENPTESNHTEAAPVKLNNKSVETNAQKVVLDAPIIAQKPELKNGCEVTSLAMMLQHAGIQVGKMELAKRVKKENHPIQKRNENDVTHWGNPNHGFVGDITGKSRGYAVYHKPLEELAGAYLPGRIINLTGSSFDELLNQIRSGKPVVVWTTTHFTPPKVWDFWLHGNEQIRATREEHAVLLVGFDPDYVYVNDPLTGKKALKVKRKPFIDSWVALGRQALSYK